MSRLQKSMNSMTRRSWLAATVTGAAGLCLGEWSLGAAPPQAGAPAAPAQPALSWPAFHGGGPLRGVAAPIGAPPMKERWSYVTNEDDPSSIEGGAAVADGTAYVGDQDGTLHAIGLADGKRKWAYKAENGFETTPLVVPNVPLPKLASYGETGTLVLIGDLGGTFHAVDAKTGQAAWKVETEGPIHASANAAGPYVVFGNDSAVIYCLNAADGKQVWRKEAGDRVNAAPAIGWGRAFVSGCDAQLRAIDLKDGNEAFAVDIGALAGASPALLDDTIIVATDQGRVLALTPDGQKQLWLYEQVEGSAMVYGSPAVADGVVVVGARDRHVHAIDVKTGQRRWAFPTRGDVESSPAISGGRVYVGSKDKRLYVLDLQSGKKLWEFTAGRAIVASPAIAEGVVVVGDTDGTLYCFEPAGGK